MCHGKSTPEQSVTGTSDSESLPSTADSFGIKSSSPARRPQNRVPVISFLDFLAVRALSHVVQFREHRSQYRFHSIRSGVRIPPQLNNTRERFFGGRDSRRVNKDAATSTASRSNLALRKRTIQSCSVRDVVGLRIDFLRPRRLLRQSVFAWA